MTQHFVSWGEGQRDLYFMVNDFAEYIEDYMMDECHNWYNGSVWHKDWSHKIYIGQWPIFHGPVILPYILKKGKQKSPGRATSRSRSQPLTTCLVPNYLNNLVLPLVQENTKYSLRNVRNIQTLQCNTNLLYNSFLPSAIRSWNNLSEGIRNSPSFSVLKQHFMQKEINHLPIITMY